MRLDPRTKMVMLGGTRLETASATGCNWSDGTTEPKASSGSRLRIGVKCTTSSQMDNQAAWRVKLRQATRNKRE